MAKLEQDAAAAKQVSIMDMIAAINHENKASVLCDLADARIAVAAPDTKVSAYREQRAKPNTNTR